MIRIILGNNLRLDSIQYFGNAAIQVLYTIAIRRPINCLSTASDEGYVLTPKEVSEMGDRVQSELISIQQENLEKNCYNTVVDSSAYTH